MISLMLSLVLAAPFPLPAIDGKPLAVSEGQKSFRIPMRFEKVKRFYAEQLGEEVSVTESGTPGQRVLALATKAKSATWKKAMVREGETETVIEVTPVLRLDEEQISGNGRPLVEFIIGRSAEVKKAVETIDHSEQMRAK